MRPRSFRLSFAVVLPVSLAVTACDAISNMLKKGDDAGVEAGPEPTAAADAAAPIVPTTETPPPLLDAAGGGAGVVFRPVVKGDAAAPGDAGRTADGSVIPTPTFQLPSFDASAFHPPFDASVLRPPFDAGNWKPPWQQ